MSNQLKQSVTYFKSVRFTARQMFENQALTLACFQCLDGQDFQQDKGT